MYSIQSVPIANDQTNKDVKTKNAKQTAFDWILPKNESCAYYDVIGRQLVKQTTVASSSAASTTDRTGFERARNQLARIDAHMYSFILCSVFVGVESSPSHFDEEFGEIENNATNCEQICCRQCGQSAADTSLFYMLHCVTLEGTNRLVNGIVDYICTDCAVDVCMFEMENGKDQSYLNRWKKTLSEIEAKIEKGALCIFTNDFYRLMSLISGIVGYSVDDLQPFIDLFVQEQFAAQQIKTLFSQNIEERRLNDIEQFLECIVCSSQVKSEPCAIGVLSTAYYNTTRIFTAPYFVCNDCRKVWQSQQFSSQRFSRLLILHRDAMRYCFKQTLQIFLCVPLQILGMDYSPFANEKFEKWQKFCKAAADIKSQNGGKKIDTLLWTVESDMLNKVFGLVRLEQESKDACETLHYMQHDPCVAALSICVKKCLCEQCIIKNLGFIEILKYYEYARDEQSKAATDALDNMVCEFSELCRGDTTNVVLKKLTQSQQQRRRNCHEQTSVSATVSEDDDKFYKWRLPLKKHKRKVQSQCTQKFAKFSLTPDQMETFYDESCFYISPMF